MSSLEYLIYQKQGFEPLRVYPEDVRNIPTPVDHFPYLKFYRGQFMETSPHVFNRDAGFALRSPQRLTYNITPKTTNLEVPFQIPCSTILPRLVPKHYDERSNLTALFSR